MAATLDNLARRADMALGRLSFGTVLLALYLLSLALALFAGFAAFYRSDVAALDFDEWEYWQLAGDLMQGRFDDPGRRTLGYPALLAVLRTVSDNLAFVQVAVSVVAATAPPLLAAAVRRTGAGNLAAVLAGLALTFWPPQLFIAASLYSETLALPMLLGALVAMPAPGGLAHISSWLAVGLLLGLLAHVRTMYQLLLPVLLLALWLENGRFWPAVRAWALIVAAFMLAVLPWSVFVSERLGTPVLLTANGGETLAGGLNGALMHQDGSSEALERRSTWTGPGKWLPSSDTGYLTPEELGLPYTAQDRLLRERTVAWLVAEPGTAAYLTWRKLAYQWAGYPWRHSDLRQVLFGALPTIALVLLFGWALWRDPVGARRRARFTLMPLFVIGIALISWGSWRFRQPADAAMIAIVACALAATLRRAERAPSFTGSSVHA